MQSTTHFGGFPEEGIEVLLGLEKNNRKEWFEQNRSVYETALLAPLRAYVTEMGDRLRRDLAPMIVAEPALNRSLYRIYRDVRFSKDKRPYKTQVAALLWEGGEKHHAPGFYFQLDARNVMFGAGIYQLLPSTLDRFRRCVDEKKSGERLVKIIAALKAEDMEIGGQALKRAPRGYPPDHPRVDLLKHKGLYTMIELPGPPWLHTAELLDHAEAFFRKMGDLHRWLRENL